MYQDKLLQVSITNMYFVAPWNIFSLFIARCFKLHTAKGVICDLFVIFVLFVTYTEASQIGQNLHSWNMGNPCIEFHVYHFVWSYFLLSYI